MRMTHVPRVLRALMTHVLCALRAFEPDLLRALHALVPHVPRVSYVLCSTCSRAFRASCAACLASFMCHYHFFCSCFPMLHVALSYLFPTCELFQEFTSTKIKIMCRQYFEVTVNINQQYNVFELYLDKHFCSDTNPDPEFLRVC